MRRSLLARVLCPHCWNRFPPEATLWVASHPDLRGDSILGADEARRFLPSHFAVSGEAIDERGERCQRLACPRCHLVVPPILLEKSPLIFSLVGVPASGKTYFLASAVWRLRQSMPSAFALAFADADAVGNRLINESEERLFLGGDLDALVHLEKTELQGRLYNSVQFSEGATTLLPNPFLFSITPTREHPNGRMPAEARHVLCLYDNAGEHFHPGADSSTAPGTQHLARSKVILFLYDPTQDARFRARLGGRTEDPQLAPSGRLGRQDTVLTEMVSRVRAYSGIPTSSRLRQPLVVIVSKSDTLGALLPGVDITSDPWVSAVEGGIRRGILDRARIDDVSARLREVFVQLAPEFLAAAEDAFERVLFIPVSAIGGAPRVDGASGLLKVRRGDIKPRWVDVPLLYPFARWSRVLVGARRSPQATASGVEAEVEEEVADGA